MDPWQWYIYLDEWLILNAKLVGKYTARPMGSYGKWLKQTWIVFEHQRFESYQNTGS